MVLLVPCHTAGLATQSQLTSQLNVHLVVLAVICKLPHHMVWNGLQQGMQGPHQGLPWGQQLGVCPDLHNMPSSAPACTESHGEKATALEGADGFTARLSDRSHNMNSRSCLPHVK